MKLATHSRLLLVAVVLAALAWFLIPSGTEPDGSTSSSDGKKVETAAQRLATGLSLARVAKSKTDATNSLTDMRRALRQMDTAEARAWILAELASGADFETQLDLTIGTDQNLTAWPSYRVFLIDMLYLVDPAAAAEKSRELLQPAAKASPDEWAVAMRNLARGSQSPADTDLLKARTAELVRNKTWRSKPSSGYLEAFDVIVHTQNTALAPDLMSLCDNRDERGVRHAAFLTLDRLVMSRPADLLPQLDAHAAKQPQSRLMISNMMARADIRDAAQRQAVENYLASDQRSAEELRGFASVFPNGNVAVSQNLLTRAPVLQGSDLAAQDRAALELVTKWLADPRFQSAHEDLREAQRRLVGFVNGAAK